MRLACLVSLTGVACLVGAGSAAGLCTDVACYSQPAVWVCGPCLCIPPGPWGYSGRQWGPWPGDEYRQDIVFPQTIGIERLATPRGERPKALPRETYSKPRKKADIDREMNGSTGTDIQIREGAPVEPIEVPRPFEYVPELN